MQALYSLRIGNFGKSRNISQSRREYRIGQRINKSSDAEGRFDSLPPGKRAPIVSLRIVMVVRSAVVYMKEGEKQRNLTPLLFPFSFYLLVLQLEKE